MPSLKDIADEYTVMVDSLPLVDYHQQSELDKASLFGDELEAVKKKEYDENEEFVPYMKQEVNLHLICDFSFYQTRMQIPPPVAHMFRY